MSFYDFFQKLNSDPDEASQPIKNDYMTTVSNGRPPANAENGSAELRPLTDDDMKRYASDDVAEWMAQYGKNTTRLGEPLSDEEFRDFCQLK